MKKEARIFLAEIVLIILICSSSEVILSAFLWVILHEVSHIVLACMLGCKFYNIELHVFGAKAELGDLEILTDVKRIFIYLAGPLFNFIVFIIFFIISFRYDSKWITTSLNLNLGLAIFNLLPAYPLDGARIYEILISKKILYKKSQKIIRLSSYCIAMSFICISLLLFILIHKLNISMVIAAFIIIYVTRAEQKSTMYITMGNMVKKRKKLIKNNYIENKSLSVYYKSYLVNVLGLVDRNKFNTFYVLDDDMELLYILQENELISALKFYGNLTLEEYREIREQDK
ncbi:M50 family metallopeptidase [Clostridium chauvoei]|uniref:M50 family metallopeptidase n=1 Tax=Clostridium chauvoei TaxID=46867 RepID=UPI001C85EDF2|nr:M50 family metallopeptidase [Clostridium chauvoei]MBX7412400.1 M50 family metallopeptidase [Clostridium chauvoei]MBX7415841.1 M50 family metallopeptidase [Clostridium chauvoei]MBX7419561.1 M50 family metallopeptidase [Clostridium chauvoei]